MNRRAFLTQTGIALGSLSILATTKKVFAQEKPEECKKSNCIIATEISNNHRHEAIIPLEDVLAGEEKSYNIKGASSHPHTLTVTAEHFAALKTEKSIDITSSNDAGHTHIVRLTREFVVL